MKMTTMLGSFAASALLVFSTLTQACIYQKWGTPKQSDFVHCYVGYDMGYSYASKASEWVMYEVEGTQAAEVERQNDFRENTDLPTAYRTYPTDYDEPVYDQGHLANSESINDSIAANSETFLMSNMVPQDHTNNIGIWKGLENRERKWAKERGEVLVMVGALYEGTIATIGTSQVLVPSHLWKVIYDPIANEAIAYIIPNQPLYTAELDNYLVSVDDVEARAGIDLLSNMQVNEADPEPHQW